MTIPSSMRTQSRRSMDVEERNEMFSKRPLTVCAVPTLLARSAFGPSHYVNVG
jgi:hypothetical protein